MGFLSPNLDVWRLPGHRRRSSYREWPLTRKADGPVMEEDIMTGSCKESRNTGQ